MLQTKRHYLMMGGTALLAATLGVSASSVPDRPNPVTVPEHTPIHVTLDQSVTTKQNRPGDHFAATVSAPVVVDGQTVIPQGTHVDGVVMEAKRSGRLKGRARLQLSLQKLEVEGQSYDVRTVSQLRVSHSHKKRNWLWIGGGAGGGAAIGALAAGGTGALIGGPVGAAAGTTVAVLTGKHDVQLRPETPLTFKLAEPVTIPVKS